MISKSFCYKKCVQNVGKIDFYFNLHCDKYPWQVTQDEHGDRADEDDGHVGLARLSRGRYRGRPVKQANES